MIGQLISKRIIIRHSSLPGWTRLIQGANLALCPTIRRTLPIGYYYTIDWQVNTLVLSLETAEIVSINPLIPQSWGTFKVGGHPQTPSRKYPAPLFQRSLQIRLELEQLIASVFGCYVNCGGTESKVIDLQLYQSCFFHYSRSFLGGDSILGLGR